MSNHDPYSDLVRLSERGVHAVFRIGWNENVAADVDAGAGAFLERDDREAIEKVIQHLFAFGSRLGGDSVTNLRRGIEDTVVVADLGQTADPANGHRRAKGQEIPVIDLGRKAGCPQRIESDVLVEVEREAVWADGPMKGNEHLPLLGVTHALHGTDEPRPLRH